ncbi:hypothetical protein BH18ACT4_BH18ACT4_06420 [soil metagenome]
MLLNHRRALRFAGAALAAAGLLFLLVAVPATRDGVQAVDDRFQRFMVSVRTPALVRAAEALALIGGVWVTWTLRAVAVVALVVRRRWMQLGAFALAGITSEALLGPLKSLYARPRPPDGLLATDTFSFPSGHALAGAVTAVGIVVVLMAPGSRRWRWEIRAAVLASSIALSRTYLSVHWLSDVLAGGLLGIALAIGWPALLQGVRERSLHTSSA